MKFVSIDRIARNIRHGYPLVTSQCLVAVKKQESLAGFKPASHLWFPKS